MQNQRSACIAPINEQTIMLAKLTFRYFNDDTLHHEFFDATKRQELQNRIDELRAHQAYDEVEQKWIVDEYTQEAQVEYMVTSFEPFTFYL